MCLSLALTSTLPTTAFTRTYLRRNVKYRKSDVVITTFPKCGTTLTEQVVLLLLNGGDAAALDPLSKNSANLTGMFVYVYVYIYVYVYVYCVLCVFVCPSLSLSHNLPTPLPPTTGKFGKVWPEACIRSPKDCSAHDGTGPEEFLPQSPEWFNDLPEPR